MTILAQELIDEARTWYKVPFLHQGRNKEIGVDCLGFLLGVAHKLKLLEYRDIIEYGLTPDSRTMCVSLKDHLIVVPDAKLQPAVVLHIAVAKEPTHLAILTEKWTIIHSIYRLGVREHRLDNNWRCKIRGIYKIPGVQY